MTFILSWRNLWRNRYRTFITVSSISFAVILAVLMQSLRAGIFDNLVKNVVSFYAGYLQIHKQGYWKEKTLENAFVLNDSLKNQLLYIEGIESIAPRLESFMLVTGDQLTKGCICIGTEPELENQLTHLADKIVVGEYFKSDDRSILLAEGLAKKLNLRINDTIVLLGQGYQGSMAAGKYPIKGLVHFGSPDLNAGMIFLPLRLAQELLSAENIITTLVLNINNPEKVKQIQNQIKSTINSNYEVMSWDEMLPEISNHIKADTVSMSIFSGFLYFIIGFGIFGTILMMTMERKQEFGMLIAIGMKKIKLGIVLLQETILISLIGILCGIFLSYPIVIYLNRNPIKLSGKLSKAYEQFGFEPLFPTSIDFQIIVNQAISVLLLSFLLGLYPLWHIKSLNPVHAMKR